MLANRIMAILAVLLLTVGVVFNLNKGSYLDWSYRRTEVIGGEIFKAKCPDYPNSNKGSKDNLLSSDEIADECGMTIYGDVQTRYAILEKILSSITPLVGAIIGIIVILRRFNVSRIIKNRTR